MPIPAPTNARYNSLDEATEAAKGFALANGYALKTQRTRTIGNKAGSEIKNRVLACVHGGKPTTQARVRSTSTLRQGCPFQLTIRKEEDDCWSSTVTNAEHNHEAVDNVAAYPAARALSTAEAETVHNLTRIGAQPRVVLSALRESNATNLSTAQDIYNVKKAKKRKMLDGRTAIEALLEILIDRNIQHEIQRDHTGNLTCLFIFPKSAENIAKKYSASKVFPIDSTYKTNQYQMPLLHGTGVTATNETFTLFYCFMRHETEEFYTWAMNELKKSFNRLSINSHFAVFITDRELALMNAISLVFPHSSTILCIWHINKNVLAKQRSAFDSDTAWKDFMGMWQGIIFSSSEAEYEQNLDRLLQNVPASVFAYLSTTWLRYKEKFVLAWIRHISHFGHTTTSRVESAHAALKKWLQVSTGDMLGVCLLLERACDEQERNLSQTNNVQQTRNLVQHNHPLWNKVKKTISCHALKQALKQYYKALAPQEQQCSNIFTSTMGIPCSHRIRRMLAQVPLAAAFEINDFDQHWWLQQPASEMPAPLPNVALAGSLERIQQRYDQLMPHQHPLFVRALADVTDQSFQTLSPVTVATRGRPSGSTRRNLSDFEYVERQQRARQQEPEQHERSLPVRRHCRICKEIGHNIRTCPQAPPHISNDVGPQLRRPLNE